MLASLHVHAGHGRFATCCYKLKPDSGTPGAHFIDVLRHHGSTLTCAIPHPPSCPYIMRLTLVTRLIGMLLFFSSPLLAQELPARPGAWPPASDVLVFIPESSGHSATGDVASELRSFQRHYPGHPGQHVREHPRKRRHLSPEERHQLRHDVHRAGRELYRHHPRPPLPAPAPAAPQHFMAPD